VGGAPGGFYTQAQCADLAAYARAHYITIVTEIDMPGHIGRIFVGALAPKARASPPSA
jgi:hexosaminidase